LTVQVDPLQSHSLPPLETFDEAEDRDRAQLTDSNPDLLSATPSYLTPETRLAQRRCQTWQARGHPRRLAPTPPLSPHMPKAPPPFRASFPSLRNAIASYRRSLSQPFHRSVPRRSPLRSLWSTP
jgi:hypothetical protein